jgi:superfamily II DNA or RNA helicase
VIELRSQQAKLQEVCVEIRDGAPIKEIDIPWAPGTGKSSAPVIIASILIPTIADKLIWIAPRNALKYQGEAEFVNPRWETPRRLRACNGNEAAPDRGLDGYVTTFQAIGMSPGGHQDYVRKNRTVLFLDEFHHIREDSNWAAALAPMMEAARLIVPASGTLSRGDGNAIHGMDYDASGFVDLRDTETRRVIRYTRGQAIRDGVTFAPELITLDGSAAWITREGVHGQAESIAAANEDRSSALYTVLRTDFAFALLAKCLDHWSEHRKGYEQARCLIVAPDIKTAKEYHARIAAAGHLAEIATSDDTPACHRAVADFKNGAIRVIVSVGVCYEGLDVPQITHVACLTHIRSVPWLEQMAARANRKSPGKTGAWIFAPADRAMLKAWYDIENEVGVPLADEDERGGNAAATPGEESQLARARLTPLWSTAHGVETVLEASPIPATIPASEAERILRDNIRQMRATIDTQAKPGSRRALLAVFDYLARGGMKRDLEDMTTEELTAGWMAVRERFSAKLR